MTQRAHLHALVEKDPVLRALEQAPADDEPLTEDDLEALQEAFEDRDQGRVRSHEEARDEKVHDLVDYGSRWVEVAMANGRVSLRQVSLTWEDLLDPQEGDHVP
jgi:hypothetical protein